MVFGTMKNMSVEVSALEEKINHLQRRLAGEIISLFGEVRLLRLRAMLRK